jgi:SAM-dependent methyltransferase
MNVSILQILLCPFCGGTLTPSVRSPLHGIEIEHGLLTCGCSEFPVLGGIPVFVRDGHVDIMKNTVDQAEVKGPPVRMLRDLVRSGAYEDALLLLLVPRDQKINRLLKLEDLLAPGFPGRARLGRIAYRRWLKNARRESTLLFGPVGRTLALDAFDLYYRRATHSELYNHFAYRFGQPRHLSGLALATLLPTSARPILDLACGFGHVLHSWAAARPEHPLIGLDRNFFQLYVAKRWIAPTAEYVCSDANSRLPFASRSFCGVFCDDAFHYFVRKVTCAEETQRVIEDSGMVILARIGNSNAEPREGVELTPPAYTRLFPNLEWRLLSDRALLRRYLDGFGPNLAQPTDVDALASEKWLSLVASRGDVWQDHGTHAQPHGLGKLRINPLYHRTETGPEGTVSFELVFPSKWYEFENADCRGYMPARITLGRKVLVDIERGERTPEVDRAIRSCVVLGLPEHYC